VRGKLTLIHYGRCKVVAHRTAMTPARNAVPPPPLPWPVWPPDLSAPPP
jgi:hypothetical protein